MESLQALNTEAFINLPTVAETTGIVAVAEVVDPVFDTEVFNSSL